MLKSLHVEGSTPLHKLSVRIKLAGLFVASLAIFFTKSPLLLGGAAALAALVFASVGMAPRDAASRLAWPLVSIALVALATGIFETPLAGLATFLRFATLILLAAAVTASSETGDVMEEVTVLMRPFERLGLVNAADIGLALGLVLRFVPDIALRYESLRESHAARGLPVRPLRMLAPMIILTLKDADMIAMAIDARGLRRQ
ncbi:MULTISPECIES: energy-coupling factor transporter transmembrane protein EcfT [unclassified Rhizobium]|uniref:energy-coupling factor transporter transmembrane component T family protein n=1 Tax=unclassified Rhizobium TaxID=2613769 RepID=UPI0009E7BAD2|nr:MULTISPECIES: energy-coupling factor transporter transmembrane protein EcfT [unclassified Rhizobium]